MTRRPGDERDRRARHLQRRLRVVIGQLVSDRRRRQPLLAPLHGHQRLSQTIDLTPGTDRRRPLRRHDRRRLQGLLHHRRRAPRRRRRRQAPTSTRRKLGEAERDPHLASPPAAAHRQHRLLRPGRPTPPTYTGTRSTPRRKLRRRRDRRRWGSGLRRRHDLLPLPRAARRLRTGPGRPQPLRRAAPAQAPHYVATLESALTGPQPPEAQALLRRKLRLLRRRYRARRRPLKRRPLRPRRRQPTTVEKFDSRRQPGRLHRPAAGARDQQA